jgi:hypothetical protein
MISDNFYGHQVKIILLKGVFMFSTMNTDSYQFLETSFDVKDVLTTDYSPYQSRSEDAADSNSLTSSLRP